MTLLWTPPIAGLVVLAAVAGVVGQPTGPPPLGIMPEQVRKTMLQVRNEPLAQRMKAVSDPLVNRFYRFDPLGEGSGYDSEPLVRYDAFDCLTFVEEVLALSLAAAPEHAAQVRLSLRYRGSPTYAHRRHFMALQWIPDAIESGWLRDTTHDYGSVQRLVRQVDATTWAAWPGRHAFALSDDEWPTGTMALQVLPLDQAIAAADRIRPGSLVLTVRVDRPSIPYWITHVGFVIPGTPRVFRHASRMGSRQVADHSLASYLRHLVTYTRWPVAGVSILEPVEQGPRRALLPLD